MNWKETLDKDRSKETIQRFVDAIILDPSLLPNLIELIDQKNEGEKSQFCAAWILGYLSPLGLEPFLPYLDFFLELLETPNLHPTIPRSITRLFQDIILPEAYHGKIIDITFYILSSEEQSVAARVNCMTILYQYVKIHPDLAQELSLVIREILEYRNDPSIVSRGKKVLHQLKKYA